MTFYPLRILLWIPICFISASFEGEVLMLGYATVMFFVTVRLFPIFDETPKKPPDIPPSDTPPPAGT